MNSKCVICGGEEYSMTSDGRTHLHKSENYFMCAPCTQKYISLPADKQAAFRLPLEYICRKMDKNGKK